MLRSQRCKFAFGCCERRKPEARTLAWVVSGQRRAWRLLNRPTFCATGAGPATKGPGEMLDVSGGNGSGGGRFSGNGGGDDQNSDEEDESLSGDELLPLAQAESIAAEKGFQLPQDYAAAAMSGGLRASTLMQFAKLRGLPFAGFLVGWLPWVRDRMVADPRFLFKVLAEVGIDSGCCTVAEVRKRGEKFWGEFEFYLSDILVGFVLDVALVTMLAPVSVIGAKPRSSSMTGIRRWWARLPSAVCEASVPNIRQYTPVDRISCFFVKGIEYGFVGLCCGFVGQGTANGLMALRRRLNGGSTEDDVPVPPLVRSALVWSLFMGVSSNVRYQTVVGLERVVDLTIARRVPQVAYAATVIIRFINNIIGGENFIDLARWAGVQ